MSENGAVKLNLVQKLCQVMAAVERVAKNGRNEFHKYDYAREADIVEAIRGELAQRNLFIFPSVTTHSRTNEITDIMVRWTFCDGDSGEVRDCDIPGTGHDKGDKGVYKALTGSEKYFLMKAFLIPTGDDPEKDEGGSKEAAQAVAQRKLAEHEAKKANGAVPRAQIPTGGLNLPPVPPAAPPVPLESAGEGTEYIHGIIKRVVDKVTKDKRAFKEVGMLDQHDKSLTLSSFDNFQLSDGRFWQYLTPSVVGLLGTFTVAVKEKGGKTYYNIINVELLGEHRWDNGVGVMQREAAEEPQVPF